MCDTTPYTVTVISNKRSQHGWLQVYWDLLLTEAGYLITLSLSLWRNKWEDRKNMCGLDELRKATNTLKTASFSNDAGIFLINVTTCANLLCDLILLILFQLQLYPTRSVDTVDLHS
jgi:hypothetical protein